MSFQLEDVYRTCIFGPKLGQVQRGYPSWLLPACMLSNTCFQGAAATFSMRKYSAKAHTCHEHHKKVVAVVYHNLLYEGNWPLDIPRMPQEHCRYAAEKNLQLIRHRCGMVQANISKRG